MTDRAAEEGSNPGDGEAVQAAAPVNQGQVPNEAGSVKQRQGGRRNADEYKEITEGEEVHVTLIRDKDAKGRSREDYVGVCLSKVAKASQLQLSDDRMTVTGQKGYR